MPAPASPAPTAPRSAGGPPRGAQGAPAPSLAAWLRTREGKIAAGGTAVLAVIILALRRAQADAGGGAGGPGPLVPTSDGTLQGALDQVAGGGGTLAEWITATGDLTSEVADLRDLLEAQDPMDPATPAPAAPRPPGTPKPPAPKKGWLPGSSLRRIGRVGQSYSLRSQAARFSPSPHPDAVEATLRRIVALNPSLKGKTTVPGGFPLKVPIWG